MFVVFCPTPSETSESTTADFGFPFTIAWVSGRPYMYFMCHSSLWIAQISKSNSNHTRHLCSAELSPFTTNIIPWETAVLWRALKRCMPEASPKKCSIWMSTVVSPSFGILPHTLEWCMLRAGERWFILVHQTGSKCGICLWMLAMEVEVLSWRFRSQTTDLVKMDAMSGEKEVSGTVHSTGGVHSAWPLTWFPHCGVKCLLIKISAAGNSSG